MQCIARKHGLLAPEEIKAIRTTYGLSQRALARILGWGLVTIQRYEQGALQDTIHDAILREVHEDPGFLFHQFEKNRGQFSRTEAERIENSLAGRVAESGTALAVHAYEDAQSIAFSRDRSSRGFRQFEYKRFAQVVSRIATSVPRLYKTKLAKLLWLCDFCSFVNSGESLSGLVYCRLPYGPAPEQYHLLLGFLEADGIISLTPHEFESGGGDIVSVNEDIGTSELDDADVEMIDRVITEYGHLSSRELSDRSHRESIWQSRSDGEGLPYSESFSVKMVQALAESEK